jgi:hypothetical protein
LTLKRICQSFGNEEIGTYVKEIIWSISKNESKENVRTGYHNKIIKHPQKNRVGLAIPEIE